MQWSCIDSVALFIIRTHYNAFWQYLILYMIPQCYIISCIHVISYYSCDLLRLDTLEKEDVVATGSNGTRRSVTRKDKQHWQRVCELTLEY